MSHGSCEESPPLDVWAIAVVLAAAMTAASVDARRNFMAQSCLSDRSPDCSGILRNGSNKRVDDARVSIGARGGFAANRQFHKAGARVEYPREAMVRKQRDQQF